MLLRFYCRILALHLRSQVPPDKLLPSLPLQRTDSIQSPCVWLLPLQRQLDLTECLPGSWFFWPFPAWLCVLLSIFLGGLCSCVSMVIFKDKTITLKNQRIQAIIWAKKISSQIRCLQEQLNCPTFCTEMSKQATPVKRGRGRPKTGVTKEIIKASVDIAVAAQARKTAMKTGESFSQFVSRAINAAILQAP